MPINIASCNIFHIIYYAQEGEEGDVTDMRSPGWEALEENEGCDYVILLY
jgi:hypothetical protein